MAENVNKVVYNGKVLIDLTADTVTADKLLKSFTAHDKAGDHWYCGNPYQGQPVGKRQRLCFCCRAGGGSGRKAG